MSGTKRISALTELASTSVAGEDILAIVDMSQASVTDKTKHMQVSSLLGATASDSKPKVSFKTVAAFIADNNSLVGYAGSGAKFELAEGDIFEAGGFRYSVRATGASDNHVASAGGFKADVLSTERGLNVKAFGATGDGATADTTAVQAAVDAAIANGVKSVFFPFSQRERYRLTSTVTIVASGFAIRGDATPVYEPENGGYIFADSSVVNLFNYGNDSTVTATNQFVCDGVAFYSSESPVTQTAIKHAQNNNGPHRGTLLRDVCAKGFVNVISFDVATGSNLSAASVVVENCVFRGNTNAVNAVERALGLHYVGNQSEQGARITGAWDSGITIEGNMLEGQSNPIDISSSSPNVRIENNYFEANSGDFHARIIGTTRSASLDIRPNYVQSVTSTDIIRIGGNCRLSENAIFSAASGRKSSISIVSGILTPGSDFYGDFYASTSSSEPAQGYTFPHKILPPDSTAVTNKALGAVTLQTPFGQTTTGATVNGFPATYYSTTISYSSGDVLVACALVRVESISPAEDPYFLIYNDAYASTGVSCGQVNMLENDGGKWFIMFAARASTVAGTAARFRFGSNGTSSGSSNIHVAAVGVDVVAAADFETFNSVDRAFVRLFNPFL